MKTMLHHTIAVLALAAATACTHAALVVNNTYTGAITNDFNTHTTPGNVAGCVAETGASYCERFAGQTLIPGPFYDALTGVPTNTLTLLANGILADNIGFTSAGSPVTPVIYGDLKGQVGEGALSILFQTDSDGIGFDLIGTNGGAFTAQFFARNGTLLGTITQNNIVDGTVGFSTDETCIAGVSLTNVDVGGIGYDNVRFGSKNNRCNSVPEPGSLSLAGLALCVTGVLGSRRRKQA